MKNFKHVFWLWFVMMLAIPKVTWASDGFEVDANFLATSAGQGVVHFKLLYLDSGTVNYYMNYGSDWKGRNRSHGCQIYVSGTLANGATFSRREVFALYRESSEDKNDYADLRIAQKYAGGQLVLTNPVSRNYNKEYGGQQISTVNELNRYDVSKSTGNGLKYAEFDWYPPTELAGANVYFEIDGPVWGGQDLEWRKLMGGNIQLAKKPETYLSDPIFMPMGENMGYYQMIISNTSGEKMRIDRIVEVDEKGVETGVDLKDKCKVDEKGYGLLIPAQDHTFYAKVEASVPYSKFQYVKLDTKNVKLSAFHNPKDFKLSTAWAKKGATKLTWTIPNADETDALAADVIAIERQLYDTSKPDSVDTWEMLGQVVLEKGKANYEYTDSTTGCYGNSKYNSVRYRIYRLAIGQVNDYMCISSMDNKRNSISCGKLLPQTIEVVDGKVKLTWNPVGEGNDDIKSFLPEGWKISLQRTETYFKNGEEEEFSFNWDISGDYTTENGKNVYYDDKFAPCRKYSYTLILKPNDLAGVLSEQKKPFTKNGETVWVEPVMDDTKIGNFKASNNTLQDRIHLDWSLDPKAFSEIKLQRYEKNETWKDLEIPTGLFYYDDYEVEAGTEYQYRLTGIYECRNQVQVLDVEATGQRRAAGKIAGFVTFQDGTGLADVTVELLQNGEVKETQKTDASGAYLFGDVLYSDTPYIVRISSTITGFDKVQIPVYVNKDQPNNYDKNFISDGAFDVDGYVYFEKTTVPIYGATFKVDGQTIVDRSGNPVISDNDGHFSFKVVKGAKRLEVQKEGHTFMYGGVYSDNNGNPIEITEKKTNIFFWDQTKVRTIGRVVGGIAQGEKTLGLGKSVNNLGEDLRIVLELDGNQRSWLVKDQLNDAVTTRNEVFVHEQTAEKLENTVVTERHRVVITPNATTGEYIVDLLPTRYKVVEVSAKGYPSLFQKGKVAEILDLTDSMKTQTITEDGKSLSYNAIYNRIYRCEPTVSIVETTQDGTVLPFIGLSSSQEMSYSGDVISVPLYDEKTKTYTFDYPVLATGNHYFRISATENYYFNGLQSGVCDSVPLRGGRVKVYDDFASEQSDTICVLDKETGSVGISIDVENTVFDIVGTNALRHMDVTLEYDGQFIDGQNLQAFVMGYQEVTDDMISADGLIELQGILRDPPGSKSYAWIDKQTNYSSQYNVSFDASLALKIGISQGEGADLMTGTFVGTGAGTYVGTQQKAKTTFELSPKEIPLVGVHFQYAGNVNFQLNERLQTSDNPTDVGADADIFYGYELVAASRVARNVRVINQATYNYLNESGLFNDTDGACHLIYEGKTAEGIPYYLISDYNYMVGPKIKSNFAYTQKYIAETLIPKLKAMRNSYLYKGTREQAQAKANATLQNVFFSLRDEDDPRYGQDNLDDECDYISLDRYEEYKDRLNYEVIPPAYVDILGIRKQVAETATVNDSVRIMNRQIAQWESILAVNEYEKVTAFAAVDKLDRDLKYDELGNPQYTMGTPYNSDNKDLYLENHSISGGMLFNHQETFNSSEKRSSKIPILGFDVTNWSSDQGMKYFNKVVNGALSVLTDYGTSKMENSDTFDQIGNAVNKKFGKDDRKTYLKYTKDGVTRRDSVSNKDLKDLEKMGRLAQGMKGSTDITVEAGGSFTKVDISPVLDASYSSTSDENTTTTEYRGYQLQTDPDSHLSIDVYHDVKTVTSGANVFGVGTEQKVISKGNYIYRVMGGATKCPYEGPTYTKYYLPGTQISAATAQVEKPRISVEKHIISGVPYGETAKFNLVVSNEGTVREEGSFDFVLLDTSNQRGASLVMDGAPLGNGRSLVVPFGTGMVKVLEIGQGLVDDYEDMRFVLRSQCDPSVADTVSLSVHFVPSASPIAVITPQDKWVLNTNSAQDSRGRYYMPVSIGGFDVNFRNFDHVELQYKQSSEPESRWTNLCSYYDNDSLYQAGAGTKAMLSGGTITHAFYGDSDPVELNYDLRAVTYSRLGNDYVTKASSVFSGVKDTRRPHVFGSPEPADGILGVGDDLKLVFSESINANRLLSTNNFKVTGLPNNSEVDNSMSLQFTNDYTTNVTTANSYLQSEAERNFAGDSFTIDMMLKPDFSNMTDTSDKFELFSHEVTGTTEELKLYLYPDNSMEVKMGNTTLKSEAAADVNWNMFQRVVLVFNKEEKKTHFYLNNSELPLSSLTTSEENGFVLNGYSGSGKMRFGGNYSGKMTNVRVWTKALTPEMIAETENKRLYGNEVDLCAYYPMNEGKGQEVEDMAQGANLTMHNHVIWSMPEGRSMKLEGTQGVQLKANVFAPLTDTKTYTLSCWYKTDATYSGALFASTPTAEPNLKMSIWIENGEVMVNDDGVAKLTSKAHQDEKWHHLALAVDRINNLATLYIDGEMESQTAAEKLTAWNGNISVGVAPYWKDVTSRENVEWGKLMTGYVDNITVWDMAVPQNVLQQRMNESCDGSEVGLLACIPFGVEVPQESGGGTQMEFSTKYLYNKWDVEQKKYVVASDEAFVDINSLKESVKDYAPIKGKTKWRNLKFNFVTKDNELLIELAEPAKDVERTMVNITAMGIEDLNGNEMANPVTWSAYIHKNMVRWDSQKRHIDIDAESTSDYTFSIDIVNKGGGYKTYSIEGLPSWMTIEEGTQGDLAPEEIKTLHITVSKDVNIGTYDEVLYLRNDEELVDPLALTIVKSGKTPDWTFKQNTLRNMQLCAQVTMDGYVVTDKNNVIASFDEYGNCMGKGNIIINQQGKSMLFLTIYPQRETKEPLTFRMWQASTGITYQLMAESAIYYDPDTIYGSYDEPVELKVTDNMMQDMVLKPVWSWVSLNVKSPYSGDISTLMRRVQWENGDQLKDPETQSFYNYNKGAWHYSKGDVKDSLTCDRMYYIMVKTAKTVQIDGTPMKDESQRTIKIRNGWNYIGYTPMMNLPVKEALTDFFSKATEGDIIKSQDEFATFSKEAGWQGNLKYMKPGKGYMLYHKAANENETVSFVYPYKSLNEASSARMRVVQDDEPLMENTYLTTMNMVTRTSGIEAQEGDCLYAYANGEVRGIAKAVMVNDQPTFFLSVGGEKLEGLSFTLERDGELLGSSVNAATYRADILEGTTDLPRVIDFSDTITYENGVWYTLTGLRVGERRPTTPGVYIFNGQKVLVK